MSMLDEQEPEEDKSVEGNDFGMAECKMCGKSYLKKRKWQLFCSTDCRMKSHQLEREAAVREYRLMLKSRGVS